MEAFDGPVPAATTLVRNRRPLNVRNRLPNAHPRENNCNITNSVVIVVAQEQLDFASLYPFTEKPRPRIQQCGGLRAGAVLPWLAISGCTLPARNRNAHNPFGSRSLLLLPVAVSDREQ